MNIEPEFTVNGLEFSETIPDKYKWDELMAIEWPEGWRVPTKQELMLLQSKEPKSHGHYICWSSTVAMTGDPWWVHFYYDRCDDIDSSHKAHSVRLARVTDDSAPTDLSHSAQTGRSL